MKMIIFVVSIVIFLTLTSCEKMGQNAVTPKLPPISERLKAYAPTVIKVDMSRFNDRQKKLISLLVEAGKIADQIFWLQTSPDAINVRDSLAKLNTPEAKELYKYVMINYGPYDRIYDSRRFVGNGPDVRPPGGTFYPLDMTKEEFEKYVHANPTLKNEMESQYTIIQRNSNNFKAIPYHSAYPQVEQIALKLEEASEYADDPAFKQYLKLRALALRTDNYFDSDMAWMDVKNSDVDVIIGPIENYEDAIFNYKAAYEAVVIVKDIEATKELQMFNEHVKDFQKALPCDPKYIPGTIGAGSQLNFVDVVYFGGDAQKGTKTIAESLPNDPKVRDAKGGGKNSMFKNMMEAKFDKIVVPIGQKILDPSLVPYVDKKAFIGFVTLHEVSHTLGRGFVFGDEKLSVRKALKERYSAIEEAKADILSMYNHKLLMNINIYNKDYIKKVMVTYLVGLYRSIRFGAEEAHGKSNLIQLNFLFEKGVFAKDKNGMFTINENIFFDKVAELAKLILTIEATGDYEGAGKLLDQYGKMNKSIDDVIDMLKDVPRDIDTSYEL